MQNRISQRKYRKKLKRLEDLESGARLLEKEGEIKSPSPPPDSKPKKQRPTPPLEYNDDYLFQQDDSTPSYSGPGESMVYGGSYPYHQPVTTIDSYPSYLASTSIAPMPSISHFADALYSSETGHTQYTNYCMPIMEVNGSSPSPYDPNPQTPALILRSLDQRLRRRTTFSLAEAPGQNTYFI